MRHTKEGVITGSPIQLSVLRDIRFDTSWLIRSV